MNILHLVSYAVFSGPLPPTLQLALAQQNLGHTVWLAHDSLRGAFSPYEEGADAALAQAGMAPPVAFGLSPKAGLRQLWRDRNALVAFVKQYKVEVVHTHLSHDHTLVALAGLRGLVRRVHTVHATRQLSRWPARAWLWRHTDAAVLRHDQDVGPLVAAARGGKQLRIATIPASIEVSVWHSRADNDHLVQAARLRGVWGVAPDVALMVHVALIADRGQLELLLAWALVQRIWAQACPQRARPVLAFVGDGPQKKALIDLAAKLGIAQHIFFPGYIPYDQLKPVYWAADGAFLAQPGNDGGARAALEAMAAGVPLVAVTQHRVLADLMAQGGGFVASARTPAAIAQALMAWLASPDRGRQQAQVAQRWLSTARGPKNEAEATLALYQAT